MKPIYALAAALLVAILFCSSADAACPNGQCPTAQAAVTVQVLPARPIARAVTAPVRAVARVQPFRRLIRWRPLRNVVRARRAARAARR